MSYPVYQVPAGDVLPIFFDTFDGGTGASITMTGLAVTDIEIYKDGSATQRASDAGYTLLDTDGIDFDGITGIHGFSIDTGDNTDAGFYTVGSWFHVVVSSITVDAQTVSFVAAAFRIMAAEDSAGVPDVNVTHFGGTAGTFASGRPEVNTTHIGGTAQTANDVGADVNDILTDTADMQPKLGTPAGASMSADIAAVKSDTAAVLLDTGTDGVVVAAASKTGYALSTAGVDAIWDEATSGHVTAGTYGVAVTDILTDTAEIGAAGAGLTNINLPDQTMNITGNITGNLSGSVGSVTGAVGSVTGNVGGNVTGSVGSISGVTFPTNFADLAITVTTGRVTVGTNADKTGYSISGTKTTLDALNDVSTSQVNAEVVDALATDTYAEPGQEAPAATTTLANKINYLYKAFRNKITQSSTEYKLYADDTTTVDQKATVSDDGSTFTRGEIGTGP